MEQRPLRLGDIVDDYCPRERRVTNYAVVAMVEEDIKQTRCTTCDAEHPYKGGKAPRRRRKEAPTLYKEVLAGKPETDAPVVSSTAPTPVLESDGDGVVDDDDYRSDGNGESDPSPSPEALADSEAPSDELTADVATGSEPEEGPVHRPLIRATLPRPEGQKDARPLPEFTIRQAGGRGGNAQFRGGNNRTKQRGGGHGGNGHRPQGGSRFAGSRPGHGRDNRGQGGGFRPAQQPRHGGRKRSR
jgi:hypothetical protein